MSSTRSSELRFDLLPDRQRAVAAMVQATREFAAACSVLVRVPSASDDICELKRDADFRYANQYQPFAEALQNGENVTIVTLLKAEEVIAFGFGEVPSKRGVEIMTIDVERASRRSAGVRSTIAIDEESFEIGIGHVLVVGLIESINAHALHTNATTASGRYLFKSLGFISTDDDNSCLLRLEND